MKGNSEFVYWLVGGLIILAVLLAFLGSGVFKYGDKDGTREPGIIEAVKTFSIPDFCASNALETRTTELVSRDVFSGLLFGEHKIAYNLSKSALQDVTIKFTVLETNELGRLRVLINGQILENRVFPAGDYEITVPSEIVSDHMLVSIEAENSYWKIWAPTIYRIEDATITFTSYFDESAQFKFYIGEEYFGLESAKADIVLDDNIGTLIVDLNGRTVWQSPVNDLQSIRLDNADIQLGDNIIKFRAAPDTRICGSGTIVVIFLAQQNTAFNRSGTITAVQPLVGSSNQFVYP